MASKLISQPMLSRGRLADRSSNVQGGNRFSGPFEEFPLGRAAALRPYIEFVNDFGQFADFDTTNDWSAVPLDTPTSPAQAIRLDIPNGILRITAGSANSTGNQVSRGAGATAMGSQCIAVTSQPATQALSSGIAVGPSVDRRIAFGFRAAINETGTANSSSFSLSMNRGNSALLLAGAQTTSHHFGFYKPSGSAVIQAYTRNSVSATINVGTQTPGTMFTVAAVFKKIANTQCFMEAYFNGVYAGIITGGAANTPTDDNYGPSLACENGAAATVTLDVDYYWMLAERI